jgi:two-component system copper resistance phosphate regulon response regulator CusR
MKSLTLVTPSPPRVLIVDDEPKIRESLAEGLELEGWSVAVAARGREMFKLINQQAFDLVVLDWMLPGRDGLDLLQQVRSRGGQIPILMLTARDSVGYRVIGLEKGADDFMSKPFALPELVARCRALLRRPLLSTEAFLRYRDLQLDTRTRVALRGGEQILLTPREVDLLEYFLRYQGQVVTRGMLQRDLWSQSRQSATLENVIDVQMMRLRKKVDREEDARLIHTLRGVGYRLGDAMEPNQ